LTVSLEVAYRTAMHGGEPVALSAGTLFHRRYEVVRTMRSGGMGTVYEVVHVPTNRRRALKVMLPSLVHDAELRARFELEARVTADVESEHIVETFDAGVDEETGAPFLVMELLRGQDLRALLLERGRLPAREAVLLLHQASMALERTHAAGIVHRDLKPDNLFVTRRDDGSPRLKVLDFGIAKLVAQSAESIKTTRSMGNPAYMAPEQIRGDGDIDARADIYSLGHIAFALLVGHAYWDEEARGAGSVYPVLLKIAQGAKEPATVRARAGGVELPEAFDAWFAWATALDPNDRADDVRALIVELARALDEPLDAPALPRDPLPVPPEVLPYTSGATGLTATLAPAGLRVVRASSARRTALAWALGLVVVTGIGAGAAVLLRPRAVTAGTAAAPASSAPNVPATIEAPAAATSATAAEEVALAAPVASSPVAVVALETPAAPPRPATAPASSYRASVAKPPPAVSPSAKPVVPAPPRDPSDTR
jgi:hypothetical protein